MTAPNRLIEDELKQIAIGLDEAVPFLNDAAEQINVWRRFAKTSYNAFCDLYAVCEEGDGRDEPADAMHGDDWRRISNFKNEVDKCREESKAMEKKQGRE